MQNAVEATADIRISDTLKHIIEQTGLFSVVYSKKYRYKLKSAIAMSRSLARLRDFRHYLGKRSCNRALDAANAKTGTLGSATVTAIHSGPASFTPQEADE